AVANSGGPDSTCLLFLLKRAISGIFGPEDQIPLVSLSVDHKLQDSSSAMSARAEATAKSLGVQHITSSVQWGTHPFPPKPTSHTALERRARDVRYHILFRDMVQAGAGAVAFGHHADDQIELCLMRMARSSTEIGAAGMRYCRRWGMGHSEGQLAWAGYEGMSRWIIRPMLGFTKDRILATCDEHALEYAVDQTNFQPELTIRNSIRHLLAGNLDIPLPRQKEIDAIQQGAARLNVDNLRSPAARVRLYSILEMFGEQREYIDEQVTSELSRLLVPSPPSTIAFPTEALGKITDPVVLAQLLMRIIRYVSARPWGSVKSEAGRSSSSITGIINGLLATDPFPYTPSPSRMKRRLLDSRKRFSGGSDVLWEPVAINARGGIRYSSGSKFGEGERPGWLAMRLKPMLGNDALTIDITKPVQDALGIQPGPSSARSKEEVHILWDNRFLLSFRLPPRPVLCSSSDEGARDASLHRRERATNRGCDDAATARGPGLRSVHERPAETQILARCWDDVWRRRRRLLVGTAAARLPCRTYRVPARTPVTTHVSRRRDVAQFGAHQSEWRAAISMVV
ncbi:adenine nucleotide alpha hydrolases-like protein, partial [Punctularia strigosozonata HHB-11173 SS5]|uniref:adenine nucleotide alpha hydrolases-like protein n=1 Tax=Punctularia strigosozonata (strain HHB-11173) TaxID=741275 RepID=UPI0004416A7A